MVADRRFGAFRQPQAQSIAGLTAICRRTTGLANTDAVTLARLGDGCRVATSAVLSSADAVLGKSCGSHWHRERG